MFWIGNAEPNSEGAANPRSAITTIVIEDDADFRNGELSEIPVVNNDHSFQNHNIHHGELSEQSGGANKEDEMKQNDHEQLQSIVSDSVSVYGNIRQTRKEYTVASSIQGNIKITK